MLKKAIIISAVIGIILVYLQNIIPSYSEDTMILINIPSRTLELWENQEIKKIYPVGVGKPNTRTPIGNFKVITKVRNPTWENPYKPAGEARIRPGKANPLGTRWIGFYRGRYNSEYGMHGTYSFSSVGTYCSHGCVRMYIKNSEELFDRVDIGTPVKVAYYTYKLKVKDNKLIINRYPNRYGIKVNPEKMIYEQLDMFDKKYIIDEDKLNKAFKMRNGRSIVIGEFIDNKPDL